MITIIWLSFLQFLFVFANGEGVGVPVVGKRAGNANHPLITHLQNYHNINYYGTIWLGTPKDGEQKQKFLVLFDTGSVDLIVINSGHEKECNNEDESRRQACEEAKTSQFNEHASKTYQRTDGTFAAKYLDSTTLTGHIAKEYVELGEGLSKIRVKAKIGLADKVKNEVSRSDGVFGLAFGVRSTFQPNVLSAIESVFTQTDIPPQIGYYVNRDDGDDAEGDYGGEIYFGGYNPNYVEGSFTPPVPAARVNGFVYGWDMQLKSIEIGEHVIKLEGFDVDENGIPGTLAVPDTGTSSMAVNEGVFDQMITYLFPTNTDRSVFTDPVFLCGLLPDNLPDIKIVVNDDVSFTLGPENYIKMKLDGMACKFAMSRQKSSRVILGNTFLQKYYSVFDYQKKEMKFALAKQPPIDSWRLQPGKHGKRLMSKYPDEKLKKLSRDLKLGLIPANLEYYML